MTVSSKADLGAEVSPVFLAYSPFFGFNRLNAELIERVHDSIKLTIDLLVVEHEIA